MAARDTENKESRTEPVEKRLGDPNCSTAVQTVFLRS